MSALTLSPEPAAPFVQDLGLTSILVACTNSGLGRMVGHALATEPSVRVAMLPLGLPGLLATGPAAYMAHDIIVFAVDDAEPDQLDALRGITAATDGRMRFLAMTDAALSLAQARALMDAGVEEVLPLSNVRPDLRAVVTLDATPEPADRAEMPAEIPAGPSPAAPAGTPGRIIAVAKARGGIGATTTAINLATLLLNAGKRAPKRRVALVDLDVQQGNAGFYLDVTGGGFLDLVRQGGTPDATFLAAAMAEHASGLHILPAPQEFVPLTALTPALVAGLLDTLAATHDAVVVDMPGPLVEWIAPVLARAERLLLVTDTSVPAIRQARRLIDFFTEDHPALPIEIVVNGEHKPFRPTPSQKEAAVVLNRPLAHWIPRDDRLARRAADQGAALVTLAPRAPMARALARLAASFPATAIRKSL